MGHLFAPIPGSSCLATFIQSLRDKTFAPVHEFETAPLRVARFEDSDSTELAEVLSAVAQALS
jgi:hypothetical protein